MSVPGPNTDPIREVVLLPKSPSRREWGTGSVAWLTPTKVKLRIRLEDGARASKTVRVAHRDQGGRGTAKEALEAFQREVAERSVVAPTRQATWTLRELMDAYIADRARVGKARSTLESYRMVARRLTNEIALTAIDQLRPDEFDHFYGVLAEGGLSPNSIRQTHAVISAAMTWAEKKGRISSNPVRHATPPDRKRSERPRIEPADANAMIMAAYLPREQGGEENFTLAVAIFLATYAGLRRGELCGLQWSDFDPNEAVLRCARQWVPGVGGQHLSDLKSDSGTVDGVRIIHFAPFGVDLIERYREHQRAELSCEPEGWLLSYDGGSTPLRAKSLTERISRLGAKLGIDASTHSFRRTSDTQLVAAGVDVDTASRRQGHTKEVMLRHYVLGADDKANDAAHRLEMRLVDQGLDIPELLT